MCATFFPSCLAFTTYPTPTPWLNSFYFSAYFNRLAFVGDTALRETLFITDTFWGYQVSPIICKMIRQTVYFRTEFPVWVYLGGPLNGKCSCMHLWSFRIFYGLLVHFMAIYLVCIFCGHLVFFPSCMLIEKNLATLLMNICCYFAFFTIHILYTTSGNPDVVQKKCCKNIRFVTCPLRSCLPGCTLAFCHSCVGLWN
jgi:hypothetical protein